MKREKVYISAPIDGLNIGERRRYFKGIAARLKQKGYEPVNPMSNGVNEDASKKEHMRADFRLLLDCDKILLCDGWEDSQGCQQEATLSLWSGIGVLSKSLID